MISSSCDVDKTTRLNNKITSKLNELMVKSQSNNFCSLIYMSSSASTCIIVIETNYEYKNMQVPA